MSERYFAYGSNLWLPQMIERIGPIRQGDDRPQVARLSNHRLAFNMQAENGRVYANLMSPGSGVLGVVYCCTQDSLEIMDGYEKGYSRGIVRVSLENGDELEAVTYFAESVCRGDGIQPSAAYLQKILDGARQHGFPDAYIRDIEAAARGPRERLGNSPSGEFI